MSTKKLDAPASTNTVRVRMIDTTAIMLLHSVFFLKPVVLGHETMNIPDMAFLIENERLGKKTLFDLGVRKDFWNLPPSIQNRFDKLALGMKIPKDIKDVLTENEIPLASIDDIIWSHSHWDHVGDTTLFRSSTDLVYGPEVSSLQPGYPENSKSPVRGDLFRDRKNNEISFSQDGLSIGGFSAHDFYGDGSLYLLSTPGHAKGHLCALARTTPDTFLLLGGDVCHFPGDLRPNAAYPLPDPIPSSALDPSADFPSPCPASIFLDNHPQLHNSESPLIKSHSSIATLTADNADTVTTPKEAKRSLQTHQDLLRTTPFYALSTAKGSAYDTPSPAVAQETVNTLIANFDSNPHVFVLLAHDPALLPTLPTLNSKPEDDLNGWFAKGWKDACYWGWLNEVARPQGMKHKQDIVNGWWRDGRKFATAKELLDASGEHDDGGRERRGSRSEGKL